MPLLVRLILTVLAGYLLIVAVVYLLQEKMLYFPVRAHGVTPAEANLPYREVGFRTADGIYISGWLVGDHQDSNTILLCHGNAGNISHRLDSLYIFYKLGFNVLIFDYRGFGRSHGRTTEKGTYLDGEAAWNYLINKEQLSPDKIIVFGRSLGGAVATYICSRVQARALILESVFTSVPDLAARIYPFLPVRWLVKFKYNSLGRLPEITSPLLVIHSRSDEIIPFSHGENLYKKGNEPKRFLEIKGSHNEGFLNSGDIYIRGLEKFFLWVSELKKNGSG